MSTVAVIYGLALVALLAPILYGTGELILLAAFWAWDHRPAGAR